MPAIKSSSSVNHSYHSYVAIDFETADYQADSACAVGMTKVENGEIVDNFYSLIRPPRKRVYFTHIHSLTWTMLKDSPNFAELWADMAIFLQGTTHFVAHNASFDKRILAGCCEKNNIIMPEQPFVCTLSKARKVLQLKSYTLDSLCKHCNIELVHHHAGADALAAAKLLLYLQNMQLS